MSTVPESGKTIDILESVQLCLTTEIDGIQGLMTRLDNVLEEAIRSIYNCDGKIIVTGMGKSGHIGNKIAATLASTGTPAVFLHPAEAIHGDLGIVSRNDLILALSNSGSTEELLRLLGPLRRMGVPIISMTGNPNSELARRADINLDVSVTKEACPLNLAPTASTTAALAMGDAIAVTLLKLRNFRPEDYALFHPGGNLGKKLVTTVSDLMEPLECSPVVMNSMTVSEATQEIRKKGYGITMIVDSQGTLVGSFSLGDLLRLHIKDPTLFFINDPVENFMITTPRTTFPDSLAARALHEMEIHNVRALFVIDSGNKPAGIIGIYEVLRAIDY